MIAAINWLESIIAFSTAGTLVAVIAVAVYGYWLNRAWLDIRLESIRVSATTNQAPGNSNIQFKIAIRNRSHRRNEILDFKLHVTSPESRTLANGERGLRLPREVLVGGEGQSLSFPGEIVVWRETGWWGADFAAHLALTDLHRRKYNVALKCHITTPTIPPGLSDQAEA